MAKLSDDDKKAFAEAMRGIKPLKQTKLLSTPQKPKITKKRIKRDNLFDLEDESIFIFSDYEKHETVESDEKLFFARTNIGEKVLRKLRLGQYNVEAVLDLHGKTIAEASNALSIFLLVCQKNQLTNVLIIHGKGHKLSKPVLKNKVNHWLRETSQVLAFCSAHPKDGGQGALYVLLRR